MISLIQLLKHNKNLTDVRLEHIKCAVNELVSCIAVNCAMLRELMCLNCSDFGLPSVINLIKQCDALMCVEIISSGNEHVDFDRHRKSCILSYADTLVDTEVIDFFQQMPDCTSVELSSLSMRVLTFICSAYNHTLTHFTLPRCASNITAQDIVYMLHACKRLTVLQLSSEAGEEFLEKLTVCIADWNRHKAFHNGQTLKILM